MLHAGGSGCMRTSGAKFGIEGRLENLILPRSRATSGERSSYAIRTWKGLGRRFVFYCDQRLSRTLWAMTNEPLDAYCTHSSYTQPIDGRGYGHGRGRGWLNTKGACDSLTRLSQAPARVSHGSHVFSLRGEQRFLVSSILPPKPC